jgi:hypothetical protein
MRKNSFPKSHRVFVLLDWFLFPFILLCPFLSWFSPDYTSAEETYDDTLCCQCHNDIVEDSVAKIDVHLPFLNHRCSYCHLHTSTDVEEPSELIEINIPNHPPMRSRKIISILVCLNCHKDFTHPGNHPVNIHLPEGVAIPDEISINPDGSISCVTCHASHASDYEYRMRFCYKRGNMKAGYFADITTAQSMGGCLICHPAKGVLPENRKVVTNPK